MSSLSLVQRVRSNMTPQNFYALNTRTFAKTLTHQELPQASERDRVLASLVTRIANKNELAMEELFDLIFERLRAFALRIVRDPGLAEEIAEDTLFQAWREASRFDVNRGKVVTWPLTICRSRAIAALRRVDVAESVEDPDLFRLHAVSLNAEPEYVINQFKTGNAVDNALMRLPPNERQIVSLAFFRGLTHQEIADHWQMPLGQRGDGAVLLEFEDGAGLAKGLCQSRRSHPRYC